MALPFMMPLRDSCRLAHPLWSGLLLLAFSFALGGHAAEAHRAGRQLYRQECARCHGRSGEGVKGKYDDALRGDWSVDKLERYITKSMPEDAPGKVAGPPARDVAEFIHDAFYSREARARNHPARVELVHLTNRQFGQALADLLGSFAGTESVVPAKEHGLQATYYRSRDFRRDQKSLERVDREVNFDFGEDSPEGGPASTNGFSMQWRGSVRAEETGEYRFILRTPNGARLWVNDDDVPLIDAWVASGDRDEHKASVHLLGGRTYPLRLDFFKFKEKSARISLQWKPPQSTERPIPARNLSPTRVPATFVVSTPFPPDDSSVGYERGVAVSKAWDEAATQAAVETANRVARDLDRLSRSKPADSDRQVKVEKFCEAFVTAAIRRPLTPEQKRLFVSRQFGKTLRPEESVKRVVILALKSPRFLYLGLDGKRGDDWDVAARLSFGLWDSMPDAELTAVAARGELRTADQVRAQAGRLLRDPRARSKMQYFLQRWLQMDHVDNLAKDDKVFPGFNPEVVADLRTSLNLFLEDAIWGESSDYRTLLLADYLLVNQRLAGFYGLGTNVTDDFVKVPVDPKERAGVLTHPYLLSAFSYQKSTSPIHRGVFLTRNIIGRALKPPPMAVAFKDAEFAPNLTMREKVAELTRPQACQTCHSVINPLGFSLEHFDAVGRFRTSEKEQPIDAVSDYTTDDGRTIRLTGARDLAEFAAGSEQAQQGFIEQLFHQVVKQPWLAYGPDVMSRLHRSFLASGCNVRQLLVEISVVSALHGVEIPSPHPRNKS
jgi:mono/diheme cytochrome c family protein